MVDRSRWVWIVMVALPAMVACASDEPTVTTVAPTTTAALATTMATPVTTTPPGLSWHADGVEGFSLLLPDGWDVVSAGDIDLADVAGALTDTEFDAISDQVIGAFDQGGKLFAFDFENATTAFTDNINLLVTDAPGVDPRDMLDATAADFERLGAVDVAVEFVELRAGEAVRVEYALPSLGIQGVAYGIRVGDQDWNLTLSARNIAALPIDFAVIADSLDVAD